MIHSLVIGLTLSITQGSDFGTAAVSVRVVLTFVVPSISPRRYLLSPSV